MDGQSACHVGNMADDDNLLLLVHVYVYCDFVCSKGPASWRKQRY